MEEIFKNIEGYEGLYQVSNFGRVKSLNFNHYSGKEQLLKPGKDTGGYLNVVLFKEGKRKNFSIHRLVAAAFIPNPDNLPQVNHRDENKTNNLIWVNPDGTIDQERSNLEWCTAEYNNRYGTHNERVAKSMRGKKSYLRGKFGKEHNSSKPLLQFTKDGKFLREWDCAADVQRELDINKGNISACCLGKRKSTGGYIWKYKEKETAD